MIELNLAWYWVVLIIAAFLGIIALFAYMG